MLKKIKTGTMGMALMVILVIIVATLNVCTVNASVSDKVYDKKTSDLKFVTKNVPGYGNVTAREDMFVGEGNNISIVINKDYREKGVITPLYEKAPIEDYAVVETPYGEVHVSPDTYKTMGKENVTAIYKKFLDLRNESIKSSNIKSNSSAYNVINEDISIQDVQSTQSPRQDSTYEIYTDSGLLSTDYNTYTREDQGFSTVSGVNRVHGVFTACVGSPRPSTCTSYHELEVFLNGQGDVVEFIIQHRSDMEAAWVKIYDNDQPNGEYTGWTPSILNINTDPIEYLFEYDQNNQKYFIYLYNRNTNTLSYMNYQDPNPSTCISALSASAELYCNLPLQESWYDVSQDDIKTASIGDTWYNAADVFSPKWVWPWDKHQYVEMSYYEYDKEYYTIHQDGNNIS